MQPPYSFGLQLEAPEDVAYREDHSQCSKGDCGFAEEQHRGWVSGGRCQNRHLVRLLLLLQPACQTRMKCCLRTSLHHCLHVYVCMCECLSIRLNCCLCMSARMSVQRICTVCMHVCALHTYMCACIQFFQTKQKITCACMRTLLVLMSSLRRPGKHST